MTLFDIACGSQHESDVELERVREHLLSLDPYGEKFALVLRRTIDQLLDGENTGRFDWKELHKTEKTHAGTLVEINLQRAFGFKSHSEDSQIHMDYLIEGVEVDCKFSQKRYGWMIPPEALGEVCLVVWADDHESRWSAGLFRADPEALTRNGEATRRGNRDGKYRLTRQHHNLVHWLWNEQRLRENLLLHLPASIRNEILNPPGARKDSGQARVNQLFRRVHGTRIDRQVIRTLGRQNDYMARVRSDGGKSRARPKLREEGIIILGQSKMHSKIAEDLGGPAPQAGEFVAFQVRHMQERDTGKPAAEIDGAWWVVSDEDAPPERAPLLPS